MSRPLRRFVSVSVVGLFLGLGGCGPRNTRTADASEAARQEADKRLAGAWVLVSFQPEVPLEPMLSSLLAAQMGTLIVTFDGQWMNAQGAGVSTTRRYRVTQAAGEALTVVNYDDKGIPYDAAGTFRGNELWFASLTSPWRGRGVLRRAQ